MRTGFESDGELERAAVVAMLEAHADECEAELSARRSRPGSSDWVMLKGDANLARLFANRIKEGWHRR